MEDINVYLSQFTDAVISYVPVLIKAILVLVIGFWVVKKLINILRKAIAKTGLSDDLVPFISSIADILLKILVLMSVAGIVGIETASIVAVLAAAGFAIGLALQGSLGNFAAGIIVLIFKPYRVGDWIEVQDKFGKVSEIQIFSTIMVTPGNKTLIIPNGQVIDDVVTNFSKEGKIRLELNVTMPYSESYPKVKEIILDALKTVPNIIQDPEPEIGIENYDSHNLTLAVRPYAVPDDYWQVTFDSYQAIKAAFYKNNIAVAYSEGVEMGKIGE